MRQKPATLSTMKKATEDGLNRGLWTIIPRARMGYESIAHEAEGRMAIDSEAMRVRGMIVLVKSNNLVK